MKTAKWYYTQMTKLENRINIIKVINPDDARLSVLEEELDKLHDELYDLEDEA